MYKCFVICPFGNKNGTEEEKRIYTERLGLEKNIFSVAERICDERGWDVSIETGLSEEEIGSNTKRFIREKTVRKIDEADVVIVVATTNDKPNVWIELGWADGFWQEPILLLRDRFALPSDVNNTIGLPFSDLIATGVDKDGAEELARELAHEIERKLSAPDREPRFNHLPKGTVAFGSIRLYNRFSHAFSLDEWFEVLKDAKSEITIASPRMFEMLSRTFTWIDKDGRSQTEKVSAYLLYKALEEKVKITLLFQHPDNRNSSQMRRDEMASPEKVREELIESYKYWATIMTTYRTTRTITERTAGTTFPLAIEDAFRVVQIRERYLPFRVTLTEKRAVTTLRFYTEAVNSGLCIDARPSSTTSDNYNRRFYEQIREELEFLSEENAQASEEAYQDFLRAG